MICPHCGAQSTPGGKCWNCTDAIAVPEEAVPEINVWNLPEEYQKRLRGLRR